MTTSVPRGGPVLQPPLSTASDTAWVVAPRPAPWSGRGVETAPPHRPVVRASLVLAVRDRAATVASEVVGLLAALDPRDEVVVVDDGSSDATVATLGRIADPRLRVLRLVAPRGTAWATNLGTRSARGRLLALVSTPATSIHVGDLVDRVLGSRALTGIEEAADDVAVVGWSDAIRGRVGGLDPDVADPVGDLAARVRHCFVAALRAESEHPPTVSAETTERRETAPSARGRLGPGRVPFPRRREPVVATLASMPARRDLLGEVVHAVLPQVDALWVYLNGYDDVPDALVHPRIRVARSQDHGDLRDNGKFFFDQELPVGYHLTIDDDLVYPRDYVDHLVAKVEQFDRRAVVGVHGAILHEPHRTYFDEDARRGHHFSTALDTDVSVHVLGTGTVMMHTSTLRLATAGMPSTGMADIWLAVAAHRAGVPLVAVARPRRWVREQRNDTPSLYLEFVGDDAPHVAALATVHLSRPDLFAGVGRTP